MPNNLFLDNRYLSPYVAFSGTGVLCSAATEVNRCLVQQEERVN